MPLLSYVWAWKPVAENLGIQRYHWGRHSLSTPHMRLAETDWLTMGHGLTIFIDICGAPAGGAEGGISLQ